MAAGAEPAERLRAYLRQLPPAARALLMAELERAALRGDEVPGGEMLLEAVRSSVRESGDSAPREALAPRLFFRPVEPFLVDGPPEHKRQGRIARASLEPLWAWICRDLVPNEAGTFCAEIDRAALAGETVNRERSVHAFQDRVIDRIRSALKAAQADDRARRRTLGQIGTPKGIEDAKDLVTILSARDAFALIASRLPGQFRNFADGQIDQIKALLDSPVGADRHLLPYALVLVMGRLASPWQLIRLAIKAAESDEVSRIAGTQYGAAVPIVLGDVERMVGEVKAGLKGGEAGVLALIKAIHDAVRGLRTELDLPVDSPWGRQLAAIRAEIADVLKTAIESMPGRVRLLLRLRSAREIAPGATLDRQDVAETEALIEMVGACRTYASELAINEMTLRTLHEVQQYLDTGTQPLLDGLRAAGDADRPFRQSQVDAAVRFCAKVFGRDYAATLTRAAEAAAHSERKTAFAGTKA